VPDGAPSAAADRTRGAAGETNYNPARSPTFAEEPPMLAAAALVLALQDQAAPRFERHALSSEFFCEGATSFDVDRDGHGDVASGPYWYAGPDFGQRFELYEPRPFDPLHYSDNFFAWPYDFDGDGWRDLLFVGFPGQQASWLRNPGSGVRQAERWKPALAFATVDNEAPAFTDLTGDGRPELVFHTAGRLGWAAPDPRAPAQPWGFHPLSEDLGLGLFTHGLGVGDVDGDGRADVLLRDGWWRQPESLAGDPLWERHDVPFAPEVGGAQMLVTDVDGDGDADVITSLNGHGYGLSWFEHVRRDGAIEFVEHPVLGATPEENRHGVCFSELHALDLADVDGDGLLDVITGKRWWAHGPDGDPSHNAPAVLYWFQLVRARDGVEFLPNRIDADSGVGVQVQARDVNGDGRMDVVVGNKKGTFVFLQVPPGAEAGSRSDVPASSSREREDGAGVQPVDEDGRPLNLDFEAGDLRDWTARGEAFADQPVEGDTVSARGREPSLHQGGWWIGGYERHGDVPQGSLTSRPFRVTERWASFLLGGGGHDETCLELVREGEINAFASFSGASTESLQRVVVDLERERGQRITLRLIDRRSDGWGHVNFDDFRLHAEEPRLERPPDVPAILPEDPVLHAGLSPAEAARAMTLPPGFQVELLLAEPELEQPIALTIDARGRLWIAEAFTYPQRAPEGEGRDRILVLEDRDLDGSLETRTEFMGGLNLVSGLEVGFGGVWIGAAPAFLFVPDRDDDLVPDGPPEVLLDGWGYQDTHETLNAFLWGPDGWLYGCHGVFTHSRVGRPGTPDEARTPLDAAIWRYHPTRHEFEVFCHGTSNPWGVDFDDHGQAFLEACVIPHLFHVIQGARYQRQGGQHFDPYTFEDIPTIADHLHYVGNDPHGGNRRSNRAGGGHAHCGMMVYLGDSFPAEWRNTLFMGNIHGNRFITDRVERNGSGFIGRHGPDFLLANDKWFRGINLKYGPDGSVYLIDWYDEQACHDNTPERWDRSNGRLYRVSYGAHRPLRVDLPALASDELGRLQSHPNDFFVRRARQVLQERGGDPEVHGALRDLLDEGRSTRERLRALWALHATGGLDEALGLACLTDADEHVQAWAVQLLCERSPISGSIREALVRLAQSTSSALVRRYLASALQRLDPEQRWPLAETLLAHGEDAADVNLPLLIWYGVSPLVPSDPERALALASATPLDRVARFMVRRAAEERAAHPALVRALALEADAARRAWMIAELADAVADERGLVAPAGWEELYARLEREGDYTLRARAREVAIAFGARALFPELRSIVGDVGAPLAERERALDLLERAKDPATLGLVIRCLAGDPLRWRAIRALAAWDSEQAGAALLKAYGSLSAAERRDALDTLSARASYARLLLLAIQSGSIARTEVDAVVLRKLERLEDDDVRAMLERSWPVRRATSAEKARLVEQWKAELTPPALAAADRSRGRDVFARTCQQCHTLFGSGGTLAPDLTGSNRADLDYLLTHAIDPNAVIPVDYQVTIAWLVDGRVVSGIARAEDADSLVLASPTGSSTIAKEDIEEREQSPLSTMPEGLLDPLAPDEVRDLVAYLQGSAQVPLRATRANAGGFFDRRSLAGWRGAHPECWSVEQGEIVGRTGGLAENEFLRSDYELADFRLVLEVRLVGDRGNSGIQFRSRALDAREIHGYQADVGPGWWGKLYEENGRGLLSEGAGADVALRDGWNTYEILAVGSRLRTALNGRVCVDLDDPAGARSGIVALQIHSGDATEVRFRNLRLEVDPEPELATLLSR
jgi:putative membrane-bound dehydrogenase-like protein